MVVSNMIEGSLYRPAELSTWNRREFIDGRSSENQYISLWKLEKKYLHLPTYRPAMLYLGHTKEEKPICGFKKIHWFLVNGEKIILNNYSFKRLELLDGS